ncbi:MAG TPA: nucleotide exchange factor GrpE [Chryseosolibacter sp.]|nr:nucleotide exchange factor GrpE [Chryseosolibacter sp.]
MENTTQQTEELKNTDQAGQQGPSNTESGATDEQAAVSERPGTSETKNIDKEVIKLQAEIAESKDKYIRLYSEFENFRRRTSREKLEMIQSANEQLIKALLPVADDFERAEKSFKDKNDKDSEGFMLISNKFKKVLDQYGVKAMELQPGSDFNADLHEAITQIPSPDESMKGKIVDVVEKGYLLNEKVIRHAKVVVGM